MKLTNYNCLVNLRRGLLDTLACAEVTLAVLDRPLLSAALHARRRLHERTADAAIETAHAVVPVHFNRSYLRGE